VKFLIGGKAREPYGRIRLDSGADSIVWMEEDREIEISVFFLLGISTPKQLCFGVFFVGRDHVPRAASSFAGSKTIKRVAHKTTR
jgi:hypothetical protein